MVKHDFFLYLGGVFAILLSLWLICVLVFDFLEQKAPKQIPHNVASQICGDLNYISEWLWVNTYDLYCLHKKVVVRSYMCYNIRDINVWKCELVDVLNDGRWGET